jgi:hypothetical protein
MTIGLSQTNPNPLFNPREMQMGLNQPIGNTFNGYGSQQAQKMFDPMESLRARYKARGAQPPANLGNTNDGFNGYGSEQAQKMFDPMENLRAMYKMRGAQPPANLGNTNDGFNGFGSQQAQKMFDPVKKTQMFNKSRGMSQ